MGPSVWIAILALVFSVVSFVISYRLSVVSERSGLRPVVVFVYKEGAGWFLRNIGKGPALNILIAKRSETGEWYAPVRVPPLPEEESFDLAWWGPADALEAGATYQDFRGHTYSSTCRHDLSKVYEERLLPDWSEEQIQRHWRYVPEE